MSMDNDNIPEGDVSGENAVPSPDSHRYNEKINQLVSLAKLNDFVTVQNISEVIPECLEDPILIENIMNILDNLEIKLLDEAEV